MRLSLVTGGLVVTLLLGLGLGWVVHTPRPADGGVAGGDGESTHSHSHVSGPASTAGVPSPAVAEAGGLTASVAGYTLTLEKSVAPAGVPFTLRFQIIGPDSEPAREYAQVHGMPLHLVVVRHDLSGYQHLHPRLDDNGTWSVELTFPEPGTWRVYADFTVLPADAAPLPLVLGADLTVPGDDTPHPLPPAQQEINVDGFQVSYQGTPGTEAVQPLLFRIQRDGQPVQLQPYLEAYGHLIVLRDGDLGYVHVHTEDALHQGALRVWLAAPGPGTYRMYLDFQVDDQVHTATFTVVVPS